MKNVLLLRAFLFVAVMALASSCSSGAHSAQGPTYSSSSGRGRTARGRTPTIILASAPVADCRPGDSTVVCCIKKYPASAMEACGATAEEVASVLRAAKALDDAVQAKKRETPEWKQHCIDQYNECVDEDWIGSCHDCLRYCEGQRAWPENSIHPV